MTLISLLPQSTADFEYDRMAAHLLCGHRTQLACRSSRFGCVSLRASPRVSSTFPRALKRSLACRILTTIGNASRHAKCNIVYLNIFIVHVTPNGSQTSNGVTLVYIIRAVFNDHNPGSHGNKNREFHYDPDHCLQLLLHNNRDPPRTSLQLGMGGTSHKK